MIETKERIHSEEIVTPQFDAILVHGYWMSEHRTGLSLRTRLAVRAGALAYDEGKGASHIVLPLGRMWGPDYESTGNLMADELRTYGVPEQAIIREGNAYSTGGEVKTFLEIARKNGWKNLLDIAFSKHFLTIPEVFKNYSKASDQNVQFRSVERIIEQNDATEISHLVQRLGKSRYEIAYRVYERGKWLLMHRLGFNYETLENRNREKRKDKGREFIVPVDVYKL